MKVTGTLKAALTAALVTFGMSIMPPVTSATWPETGGHTATGDPATCIVIQAGYR